MLPYYIKPHYITPQSLSNVIYSSSTITLAFPPLSYLNYIKQISTV